MRKRITTIIMALVFTLAFIPAAPVALAQTQDFYINVLIEPILEFNEIGTFSEGLAPAHVGDKWGVIDRTGKIVVPIECGWIYEFSEGLALANKGGKFVSDTMEGTGVVGGMWGFIDQTGNEVIPFGYDIEYGSGSFHEGIAVVKKGDKWGYIDKTGKVILPIEYDWAYDFSEGFGLVRKWYQSTPQYSFIDATGKIVLTLNYKLVESFSDGLAQASKEMGKDAKYGYIDKTGKEVIPFEYDYTTPFNEGLAMVGKIGGKSQIIDKKGNVVATLDTLYWTSSKFIEGLMVVVTTDNWKYGVIDTEGSVIVPLEYEKINDFSEGFARVSKGLNEDGFIDKTGNAATPLKYTIARNFNEGLAAVSIGIYPNNKWGILETVSEDPSQLTPTPEALDLDTASTWARDGITGAIAKGFVPADIQGSYTNVITRQEFCCMAVKWLEYRLGKNIDAIVAERGIPERMTHTFSDTTDANILAAYRLSVAGGTQAPTDTTPGLFTPSGQFSREQAATMIMNTCKTAGMDVSNVAAAGFTDISTASSWAIDGINYVRNGGIMQGTSITPPVFSPKSTYTREQSIITFNNIK